MPAVSHERPIYLVFGEGLAPPALLARLLAAPELRQVVWPPPWFLDRAGVDLVAALPGVRTIDLANLETVLRTALHLCDGARLDALTARTWREAHEQVRLHWLDRGMLGTFASLFRVGTPTREAPPPEAFRAERVHEYPFEVQYRLAADGGAFDPREPPQEGSLMLYCFDPANAAARRELGEPGRGPLLEVFAYGPGRGRHRAAWERIAAPLGGRVLDPAGDGRPHAHAPPRGRARPAGERERG